MARGAVADSRNDRRLSTAHIHVGQVTVYKRGRSWYVYYREDGASRRLRASRDRKEAEKIAAEVNGQLACGLRSSFGYTKVPIADLVPQWLEHHEVVQRSSLATVNRYRTALDHMLRFVGGRSPGLTIDRLTNGVAEEFVKYLRTVPVSPNGSPGATKRLMKDKGVLYVLQACRALVNFAARRRHMPPYATNPFTDMRIERMRIEDAKKIRVFSQKLEADFLAECPAWEFRVFFALSFTGMRPGELRHMLVGDVDVESRVAFIRNHPELSWHTKTRAERRIFLFDELLDVFRHAIGGRASGPVFLARQFADGAAHPPLTGMDTHALAAEYRRRVDEAAAASPTESRRRIEARVATELWRDMGAIKANDVRKRFIRVAKRIGHPEMTSPYIFRHGMATAMQEADVDPFVRKEIIGHTSLEMTGRYTHTGSVTLARGMKQAAEVRKLSLEVARGRLADGALACAVGA